MEIGWEAKSRTNLHILCRTGLSTQETGRMIISTARVKKFFLMEMSMRVTTRTGFEKESLELRKRTGPYTEVISKMMFFKGMESCNLQMEVNMTVLGLMENIKVKAHLFGKMARNMLVITLRESDMEKGSIL